MKNFLSLIFKILSNIFGGKNKSKSSEDNPKSSEFIDVNVDNLLKRSKELNKKFSNIKIPPVDLDWVIQHRSGNNPERSVDDVINIAENIRHYQNSDGGWGKTNNLRDVFSPEDLQKIYTHTFDDDRDRATSDFDNFGTYGHVEYLIEVYLITKDKLFKESIIRGVKYILSDQHKNGSWENKNHPAITYNDNVVQGVLKFLNKIIVNKDGKYNFLQEFVNDAKDAYEKGIECILKTQIIKNGKRGVWAQQHDHETLKPIWARSYEMPAYVSKESVAVVEVLQEYLEQNPNNQRVKYAIDSAIQWFRDNRLPEGNWARFYELNTLKPIFCDRDSKITYNIEDLGDNRRYGYGWFSDLPAKLL